MVPLESYGKDQLPIPKNSPLRIVPILFIGLWFFIPFIGITASRVGGIGDTPGIPFFLGFFIWFAGVFVVIRLGNMAVRAFMKNMVGEIMLEASSYTIERGDELRVRLHQPGNEKRSLEGVTIQFVKHEWVQYSCGTDTCTDTHNQIIDEQEFTPTADAAYDATFRVPADAMHTFNASNNRVQWFVTIRLDIPTWPDYFERYEVRCLASG